jgi:hypothetical protein
LFQKQWFKNLDWSGAHVKQISTGAAIIIPIEYSEKVYTPKGDYSLAINQLSYVMMYRDEENEFRLEVVITIPDEEFLSDNRGFDQFTGNVMVTDWKGDFVKGFRHTAAGVERIELASESPESNARMTDSYECITTEYYVCQTVHYVDPVTGDEVWSDINCELVYSNTRCTESGGDGINLGTPSDPEIDPDGPSPTGPDADVPIDDNPDEDEFLCAPGEVKDENGICVAEPDPCNTDNEYLDNSWFQQLMDDIWQNSMVVDTSTPMSERREDGGWLVDNGNGTISYVAYPTTWLRAPCGIDPPEDWYNDVPDGAFALIHSHPFFEGEDTGSVCNEENREADGAYTSGPSEDDRFSLLAHMSFTGYLGFTGYVIDGSNITIHTKNNTEDEKFERCSY